MTMVEPAIAAATQDVENSALLSGYRFECVPGRLEVHRAGCNASNHRSLHVWAHEARHLRRFLQCIV